MAWVNPATQSSAHPVTAAEWNELVNDLLFLSSHGHGGAAGDGALIIPRKFQNDLVRRLTFEVPGDVTNPTGTLAAAASPLWDSTNKWLYYTLTAVASVGEARLDRALVTTQLLPIALIPHANETVTSAITTRIGWADGALSADPTNGIFFRAVGNANWFGVCRAAGVETTTADSGIAASTVPREFRIEVTATGSVTFYIDDVAKGTITANIPATTVVLALRVGIAGASVVARLGQYLGVTHEVKSS